MSKIAPLTQHEARAVLEIAAAGIEAGGVVGWADWRVDKATTQLAVLEVAPQTVAYGEPT